MDSVEKVNDGCRRRAAAAAAQGLGETGGEGRKGQHSSRDTRHVGMIKEWLQLKRPRCNECMKVQGAVPRESWGQETKNQETHIHGGFVAAKCRGSVAPRRDPKKSIFGNPS